MDNRDHCHFRIDLESITRCTPFSRGSCNDTRDTSKQSVSRPSSFMVCRINSQPDSSYISPGFVTSSPSSLFKRPHQGSLPTSPSTTTPTRSPDSFVLQNQAHIIVPSPSWGREHSTRRPGEHSTLPSGSGTLSWNSGHNRSPSLTKKENKQKLSISSKFWDFPTHHPPR